MTPSMAVIDPADPLYHRAVGGNGIPNSIFSDTTEVYRIEKFFYFLKEKSRKSNTVACYGGAGSAKSRSIIQEFVDRFFEEHDIRILIVRKTGPSLTDTTYQMVLDELDAQGYIEGEDYFLNRSTQTLRHGLNVMMFRSLDKQEKKKSLNVNYIYIEEATEITYQDYSQLRLRLRRNNTKTNQIVMSFNPTDQYHWTKTLIVDKGVNDEEYQKKRGIPVPKVIVQHSSYKDNPFLPKDYTDDLESLKEQDKELYQIYAQGEYATVTNVIYSNYRVDDDFKFFEPLCYGLDFGFNVPSALVAIWNEPYMPKNRFYVKELFYKPKYTNAQLIEALKTLIPLQWRWKIIYADAAEPDRIEEIRAAGFTCEPADKAIVKGIDTVKTCDLRLHQNDVNLAAEIHMYKWKVDKYERVLDEPVEYNDHLMDALRYAIYNYYLTGGGAKIPIESATPKASKTKIPVWGTPEKLPRM